MNIRYAKSEDVKQISELWWEMHDFNAEFDDRYYQTKPKNECIEWKNIFFENILKKEDHIVWVAEENGQIVGYVYIQILERPPYYKYDKVAKIQEASITKEFQQKGVFRKSWDIISKEMLDRGVKMAELEIDLNNPAHFAYWKVSFYKRLWHMVCFLEDYVNQ
ncbi:MAG: GNAT family N-acetyltransferase [Candidatus Helarchaeota archaeon]